MSMSVEHEELTFRSDDQECAATLYLPKQRTPEQRLPCVVMCNGFSLTREDGLPLFAERFAAAGLAALTFDFRQLGGSSGEPRQFVDHRRQRTDLTAAVSFARTIDGIDSGRIAAWGFSTGGGLAVQVAAADRHLAAAVALFPMVDGLAFAAAAKPLMGARLMAYAVRDRLGRANVRVPVVGPPGTVAVFNQPAAKSGIERALTEDSLWRNEVCASTFLRAGFFRPVRAAHRVHCPLMVCVADNDSLVPIPPILRLAQRAPRATLHHYPLDHLDAFEAGEGFDSVVAEQIEFLTANLGSPA
ncbi:alpha/beta hydrolase [Nocardia sp. NPDC059180]|uniref:alpha/beta hydrolase n=1 Tax=Nocardia sp. NPDC059180 TaxID=3346761 RepID=UPI0036D08582